MSTAVTVRGALETAIQGIETSLGFASADYTQIHTHRLDHELPDRYSQYLKGSIDGGGKETRAIGIEVLERESHDQLFAQVVNRFYDITIEFYYDVKTDGTGVQTLINHMRAVRQAIKNMSTELSSTVDRVEEINQTRPEIVEIEGLERPFILVARIEMVAFETSATF